MIKTFKWILGSVFTLANFQLQAAIDIHSLIKVTGDNNPKCVEFYNYKDDLYCSEKVQSPSKVDPKIRSYETQKIIFDDRAWTAAWSKKTEDVPMTMIEYVPAGETIDQWNELVTSQFFPGLQDKATPQQILDGFVQNLRDSGFDPKISLIESEPNRLIFEFRVETPKNMQQDELQMITKGEKGIYILHYVIKKADMGKENREKWVQLLKQSKPLEEK